MTNPKLTAVLGHPVEHSLSPIMHNAASTSLGLNVTMLPFDVTPERLAAAVAGLNALGALGASVTIPHKQSVIALCDELSAEATAVGAVNCLTFRDGNILGDNTDASGFAKSIESVLSPGPAVILGSGGAARAVHFALESLGCSCTVISRNPQAVGFGNALSWDNIDALPWPDICALVDCTPLGLSDISDVGYPAELPLDKLAKETVVSTLIYHRHTRLLANAQKQRVKTLSGAPMLAYQGAYAFSQWTGEDPPFASMEDALAEHIQAMLKV